MPSKDQLADKREFERDDGMPTQPPQAPHPNNLRPQVPFGGLTGSQVSEQMTRLDALERLHKEVGRLGVAALRRVQDALEGHPESAAQFANVLAAWHGVYETNMPS
jgi:hypothetical protein